MVKKKKKQLRALRLKFLWGFEWNKLLKIKTFLRQLCGKHGFTIFSSATVVLKVVKWWNNSGLCCEAVDANSCQSVFTCGLELEGGGGMQRRQLSRQKDFLRYLIRTNGPQNHDPLRSKWLYPDKDLVTKKGFCQILWLEGSCWLNTAQISSRNWCDVRNLALAQNLGFSFKQKLEFKWPVFLCCCRTSQGKRLRVLTHYLCCCCKTLNIEAVLELGLWMWLHIICMWYIQHQYEFILPVLPFRAKLLRANLTLYKINTILKRKKA